MALLQDLIQQIDDPTLRERILQETNKLMKKKKFGLVFEEHLPECTPLYDVPIRIGSKVALKNGYVSDIYTVIKIDGTEIVCDRRETHEQQTFNLDELVVVAEFGEPIYPYLKPIDNVCNAPDSDLWHALIEADNYHALQLLEYLYAGKVDCIYIDPPYNTGARDWKYNNDYVDSSDSYRHSKWLSMMEKRLKLAKKLLNPKDSVLIVTIDEKEYLHLGCLLEELFPDSNSQMISSVINPKGNRRDNEFSRCEEYIYFVYIGSSKIISNGSDMLRQSESIDSEPDKSVRLRGLLRQASNHGKRTDRPNLFYPLLFEKETGRFIGHGPVLSLTENREDYLPPEGAVAMWPIASNGTELTWNLQPETLMRKYEQHFLSFGKWNGRQRTGYYLSAGQEENFKNGMYNVLGQDDDGAYIIELKENETKNVRPLTIWHKKEHSASEYGTTLLNGIIGSGRFSFPKSLYAVEDTIRFFVANKPNCYILDFFAGSGTTLHAVNLLNAEDNGHRRCIMVTNNEVSEVEAKNLTQQGYHPGDEAWEQYGIARYVTWPRTVCSIEGHDVNGQPLKGNYLGSDLPMADGFKANAAYFKLGFLDKTSVALGRQFAELLPVLWMKGGAIGKCPELENDELPEMLILPQNKMAVLIDEIYYSEFEAEILRHPEIQTVFIVTDSETAYRSMIHTYDGKECYQLYRDYLDNFRINTGR
ncbi:MAG: site-specific DNA-methyltransferase [Akkermansia sp.]|nr:site-specific DNA-methyltransferase [Akkermansia sp.]